MGMYSEHHPNRTVVRAVVGDELHPIQSVAADCGAEEWRATRMTAGLSEVLNCIGPGVDGVDGVVAYRPRFDSDTRTWSMHEVARVDR